MMAVAVVMGRDPCLAAAFASRGAAFPAVSGRFAFNLSSREPGMICIALRPQGLAVMRRAVVALAFTSVIGCAAALLIGPSGSLVAAPKEAIFIVPAHDGYDFGDCLTSGAACGQIVANSWCETQGYSKAVGFGPASREDFTGSVQTASTAYPKGAAVAIACIK
jgi:hypothetical protein